MQTFLPSPDYIVSSQSIDKVRLNKQITECYQLLNANLADGGWQHHPAAKMWRGYEGSLVCYAKACFHEFVKRGGSKTHKSWHKIQNQYGGLRDVRLPWLGHEEFHSSHRSRLLHKGNLDIIAKSLPRKPEKFLKQYFESSCQIAVRELTVAQSADLWRYLDCKGDNWYNQFGWAERPSDNYIWPI